MHVRNLLNFPMDTLYGYKEVGTGNRGVCTLSIKSKTPLNTDVQPCARSAGVTKEQMGRYERDN